MSVCFATEYVLSGEIKISKTAEAIEMPFSMSTRVGPRSSVLRGGQIPRVRGNFGGVSSGPL